MQTAHLREAQPAHDQTNERGLGHAQLEARLIAIKKRLAALRGSKRNRAIQRRRALLSHEQAVKRVHELKARGGERMACIGPTCGFRFAEDLLRSCVNSF